MSIASRNGQEKQRIWNLFKTTPEPVGYDPEPTFGSIDGFGAHDTCAIRAARYNGDS
jgi:hypothetical protein